MDDHRASQRTLHRYRSLIERKLRTYLPPSTILPRRLHQAMRYSVLADGKRLRPILTLATARTLGSDIRDALAAACAIEIVHTYSLIHDDLPAMDNAETRRGKSSSHRKFGEAVAILAGDALLTVAFEIVAERSPRQRLVPALVAELAKAIGSRGMAGGQALDLDPRKTKSLAHLRLTNQMKTAALFAASARCGAICAGASGRAIADAGAFGEEIGLAFQIIDDILDVNEGANTVGERHQSPSYPAVCGLVRSRREAQSLLTSAQRRLTRQRGGAPLLGCITELLQKRLNDAVALVSNR